MTLEHFTGHGQSHHSRRLLGIGTHRLGLTAVVGGKGHLILDRGGCLGILIGHNTGIDGITVACRLFGAIGRYRGGDDDTGRH